MRNSILQSIIRQSIVIRDHNQVLCPARSSVSSAFIRLERSGLVHTGTTTHVSHVLCCDISKVTPSLGDGNCQLPHSLCGHSSLGPKVDQKVVMQCVTLCLCVIDSVSLENPNRLRGRLVVGWLTAPPSSKPALWTKSCDGNLKTVVLTSSSGCSHQLIPWWAGVPCSRRHVNCACTKNIIYKLR